MPDKPVSAARVAALVGPHRSGKTSLLESMLYTASAIPKKGRVRDRSCVSDASPEARARQTSVEVTPVGATYCGEPWMFLDCPGSVELVAAANAALAIVDVAIVVAEPDPDRAIALAPILRHLDANEIPHVIFINKVDTAGDAARIPETFEAIREVSSRPLVMREQPIVDGSRISGIIDLVSERAFGHTGDRDVPIALDGDDKRSADAANATLVERVADFDDPILEQLLEDKRPSSDEVYESLGRDLRADRLISVFFGSAEGDLGVELLLETLRREAPFPDVTATRLGIREENEPLVRVWKTAHAAHIGKLSFARVFRSRLADATPLDGTAINGIQRFTLAQAARVPAAEIGEVVTLGRLESVATGDSVTPTRRVTLSWPGVDEPVHALAIRSAKSADEAKLGAALQKLTEEDPSLRVELRPDTQERLLRGAGEVHLEITLSRLASRFGLEPLATTPEVQYRETIRKPIEQHGRYKHQSGGHGQFGDVHLRIEPLARGEGFRFAEEVVGGAIPRQYFGAVEASAIETLAKGPLGFPVVDVSVTLTSGSYHSVDSSDAAFKSATRIAITEALPRCEPVLLEPIDEVKLYAPSEFLPKLQRLVTGRRGGQILGYDQKEGWSGWSELVAHIPRAETRGLIVELRSLTLGLGSFVATHHHDREVMGREADRVVEVRKRASA